MNFQATDFEFRYRFWLIAGIFWLGFAFYSLGDVNVGVALARLSLRRTSETSPLFVLYIRSVFVLGTLIAVLAAAIRTWAGAYLHSSVVHDAVLHSDRLVAEGPFRRLRNPLYLGTVLLAIGIGTLASRVGFLIMVAGMVFFTYRLILREEAQLLGSQGESYRRYFVAVPRMLPSLRPRVPSGGAKPDWFDAFLGETFIWSFAAGMAAYAISERLLHFWIVAGFGFGAYFIQYYARRGNRPA
ncbi:MAG TPA: methyltransferase [Candidatus Acidoferrales bacterium]|nr:methyltransferase [Candidatus Acidoferrales bacterium]